VRVCPGHSGSRTVFCEGGRPLSGVLDMLAREQAGLFESWHAGQAQVSDKAAAPQADSSPQLGNGESRETRCRQAEPAEDRKSQGFWPFQAHRFPGRCWLDCGLVANAR
jgi:hypothetical protein